MKGRNGHAAAFLQFVRPAHMLMGAQQAADCKLSWVARVSDPNAAARAAGANTSLCTQRLRPSRHAAALFILLLGEVSNSSGAAGFFIAQEGTSVGGSHL